MAKYLVVYHLNDEKAYEYEDIPKAITTLATHATNLFENVWLLDTTANTLQIKQTLNKYLGPADRMVVTSAGDTEFAGFNAEATDRMNDQVDE